MANKLKIFEKLGLIEKKEISILTGEVLTETRDNQEELDEAAEVSPIIETIDIFNSDMLLNDIKTPLTSENPVLQGAYEAVKQQNAFAPLENISKQKIEPLKPISKEPTKEEVEKKLDAMIESYERNKLLSIEDIYRKATLIQEIKSTVFMVDVYAKALPENLPMDIKRESVLNIMRASEIQVDDLLSDAYKRIDALNNVLESVVQSSEELKAKNTSTIRDLEKRIEELKRTMIEREKFQETQNTMIEYEIQRIINIVDFVKPK